MVCSQPKTVRKDVSVVINLKFEFCCFFALHRPRGTPPCSWLPSDVALVRRPAYQGTDRYCK